MKKMIRRPITVFGYVCVVLILMCALFVCETYAADTVSGTTTKKEQTIKVKLDKGAAVITVSDPDSWVFAQIQTKGSDTIGEAVGGEKLLTLIGQEKTFTVPVKKAGTYYLYLHGTNEGAKYSVKTIPAGGTLKSGKATLGTSYADNESVSWYTIKIKKTGQLKVTVKDSSYRYPGYSKVRLKKDGALISEEEHLIKGLKFSTVYGVSAGTYKIGVRSSSELYKITAGFTAMSPAAYGSSRKKAAEVKKKTRAFGVIEPGSTETRWYRIDLPAKTDKVTKRTIQIKADNSNVNVTGGINFRFQYKSTSSEGLVTTKKGWLMNNYTEDIEFKLFKKDVRTVYIGVESAEGASGTYEIYWK